MALALFSLSFTSLGISGGASCHGVWVNGEGGEGNVYSVGVAASLRAPIQKQQQQQQQQQFNSQASHYTKLHLPPIGAVSMYVGTRVFFKLSLCIHPSASYAMLYGK